MSCDFYALPHAGIRSLDPYIPGKSIEEVAKEQGLTDIIKLASNENPLGCSPQVKSSLANLSYQQLSIYPSSLIHPLRQQLADFYQVSPEQILLSNGSDLIFCLLLTAFAAHQDKHILTHDYAFLSYSIQAKTLLIPVVSTKVLANYAVDIEAMIQACNEKTALIFIANPNNPTGLWIEPAELTRLLASIPATTLLVLDEAYYEYSAQQCPTHFIDLLNKYPNLVLTRTFSKAYGLAGLRLGYAIAHPQIIDILYRLQLPFAVNQAALQAGLAALADQAFLAQTLQVTAQGIQQMQYGLDQLQLTYFPTKANFITVNCQRDAAPIYQTLQQHGIIVRPLHPYELNNYLRITIGTAEQNERFLAKLALSI